MFDKILKILDEIESLANNEALINGIGWVTKGTEQNLRDFRRYVLKDTNMSRNTHEYIEVIRWHQNRIYDNMTKASTDKDSRGRVIRSINYIIKYSDELVTYRELKYNDGDKYREITDKIMNTINERVSKYIEIK